MTPQEKGGKTTKHKHGVKVCSKCGQLVSTGYYGDIGLKGGETTLKKYGREFYVAMGKRGGRPRVEMNK